MEQYHGACHCGAVSFDFNAELVTSGICCNCSFCKRKGSVLSPFTLSPNEITINAESGSLGLYQFDSKIAKHYFCNTCGINPFLESMLEPGNFRVNLGCIDKIDIFEITVKTFDGKNLL